MVYINTPSLRKRIIAVVVALAKVYPMNESEANNILKIIEHTSKLYPYLKTC
jgi:hypothetical protein